jgi:CubicO group peptidase (beta-lactamase class C family)
MNSIIRLSPTRAVLVSLLGQLWSTGLVANAASPDFTGLERTANAEIKERKIPGCAVAVVKGEKIVFARGFGVASVETGEPVRSEMLFRLGSTTKMFTSAAVVMLAEEGKLRLDSPVGEYVKGLNPRIARLTASQLLSHTAGLYDESPMNGPHDDNALGLGVSMWSEDVFFAEPGRIFSYSNPGYWLAGLLAGTVDGHFYADVLDMRIFRPLGMARTTLRPTMAMTFPLAIGHEPGGSNGPRVSRPLADNAATWPAGQIFSSVHDLSRWCIALMHDGRLDGKQVLAPSLIRELTTPRADIPGTGTKSGFGLNLSTDRGNRLWQHGGNRAGYGSLIRMAPDDKLAVILLMNLTGATMPKTADKAMELFAPPKTGKPAKPQENIAMTREEVARCAGRYRNGRNAEELVVRDDKLFLKRGAGEYEVIRLIEHRTSNPGGGELLRFVGGNSRQEFLLVMGHGGRAEFLFRGSRALARQKD